MHARTVLWERKVSLVERCPHFRGVLRERFNCITVTTGQKYFTFFLSVQLRREKAQLEQTLEQEQEQQISKLTKKIGRLEKDVLGKQSTLEKVWTRVQ